MSSSRKSSGPRDFADWAEPARCPLERHIMALEVIGWRVVRLRPSITDGEATLWSVTIRRYDENVTMTEAHPDTALAELVRYARADAA